MAKTPDDPKSSGVFMMQLISIPVAGYNEFA